MSLDTELRARLGAPRSTVAVFVPVADTFAARTIAAGSGVVGTVTEAVTIVDYEGALYHQANIRSYADRVMHAAGRHLAAYPTTARMAVDADDVVHVGWWYAHRDELELVDDKIDVVREWIRFGKSGLTWEQEITRSALHEVR